jgi:hypothetical protein
VGKMISGRKISYKYEVAVDFGLLGKKVGARQNRTDDNLLP